MIRYNEADSLDESAIGKARRLCSRLANVFRIIQIAVLVILVFSLSMAVLIQLGVSPGFLLNMNETLPGMILNITFPTHVSLPLTDLSKNNVWSVYFGSSGILLSIWEGILELLRRTFHDISGGYSPFSKKLINRFKWGYVYIAAMALGQPVFFLAIPILMVCHYIFLYGGTLEKKSSEKISEQENVILSLAEITEQKSQQTGQHVKRVSEYSRILAQGLKMDPVRVDIIRQASMLHDIGKLMIDSSILEKPGKLTPEEFEIIKQHVRYGEQLLHTTTGDLLQTARVIALEHHERWDGKGYISGMKKDEISIEGRIVAVADVFDALVSRRSYKEAWSYDDACTEIVSQSGKQFDPDIIKIFVEKKDEFLEVLNKYT